MMSDFFKFKNSYDFAWLRKPYLAIYLCCIVAAVFLILSTTRLNGQGLYYDEVHQATAAFSYLGRENLPFSVLDIKGIPILNMNYSGAIKTGIFGIYLMLSKAPFSDTSWRLIGILLVSLGVLSFGMITHSTLPFSSLLTFYLFFITDISVILMTRHDWGPVALALFFRLLFIAIWINGELSGKIKRSDSFWLGFLVGISVFEKLSSAVLLIPFILMTGSSKQRRDKNHVLFSVSGLLLGLSPLVFANIYSFITQGTFISLGFQSIKQVVTINYLKEFVSLGAGEITSNFILGKSIPFLANFEFFMMLLLLLFIILHLTVTKLSNKQFVLTAILLISYASIGLSVRLLPSITAMHHWIIGTPFHYAAIAVFVYGLEVRGNPAKGSFTKVAFLILLMTIFITRTIGLIFLENSLQRGDYNAAWSPSFTRLAVFAKGKSSKSIFIAGDWGISNQLICYLNGEPGIVFSPSIGVNEDENISRIINTTNKSEAYVIFLEPPVFVKPEVREGTILSLKQNISNGWQQSSVESEIDNLKNLVVYKFTKKQITKDSP